MITIAFADDHVLFRTTITKIINSFEGFQVISQASNGAELIQSFQQSGIPALLVLDLGMRGMSGYDTATWIKKNHPNVKIVVLSMFSLRLPIARMLAVGVHGFLDKNIEPDELLRALRYVAENDTLYMEGNHGQLAQLVSELQKPGLLDKLLLTEQEITYIQLASGEYTHQQIAKMLHVSERTEGNITSRVFKKLQVGSRAAMVLSAARNGIVPLYQ